MDTNKRKRTFLSVDQKLQVCKRLKKGASIAPPSKELRLGKSTICDIKQNEDKLVTFVEKFNSAETLMVQKAMKTAKDLGPCALCKTFRRGSYIWTNSNSQSNFIRNYTQTVVKNLKQALGG